MPSCNLFVLMEEEITNKMKGKGIVEYIPQKALPIIHLLWYDAFKCAKFVFLPIRIILYKPGYPEASGKSHEPELH